MQSNDNDLFRKEYMDLPEAIRQYYSFNEYCWLTEEQRASLLQENTEPDIEE